MLEEKLHKEIKEYCKLNSLKMNEFVNELVRRQFNIVRFGDRPKFLNSNSIGDGELTRVDDNAISINDNIVTEGEKNETIYDDIEKIDKKKPIKTIKLK